jgi:hypothetical protein
MNQRRFSLSYFSMGRHLCEHTVIQCLTLEAQLEDPAKNLTKTGVQCAACLSPSQYCALTSMWCHRPITFGPVDVSVPSFLPSCPSPNRRPPSPAFRPPAGSLQLQFALDQVHTAQSVLHPQAHPPLVPASRPRSRKRFLLASASAHAAGTCKHHPSAPASVPHPRVYVRFLASSILVACAAWLPRRPRASSLLAPLSTLPATTWSPLPHLLACTQFLALVSATTWTEQAHSPPRCKRRSLPHCKHNSYWCPQVRLLACPSAPASTLPCLSSSTRKRAFSSRRRRLLTCLLVSTSVPTNAFPAGAYMWTPR